MTRREKRMRAAYAEALRLERLGAPPDVVYPGISERLTKPKPQEMLWQVWVETRARKLVPIGPAIDRSVADQLAATIRQFIADGIETVWRDAQVFPHVVLGQH